MYNIPEKPAVLIIDQTKKLINRIIEQKGNDTPPFLAEDYAKMLGVNAIQRTDLGNSSAILMRLGDRKIIKINQRHSFVRQNFSCAHEIGHLLFDELRLAPYIADIEFRTLSLQTSLARARVKERLCDMVATELLMPEEIYKKHLIKCGLSINSIENLAKTFMVSIPAAAIRMAETSDRQCIVSLWKDGSKYKPKTLRLGWSAGPRTTTFKTARFIPVSKKLEAASSQYKAYASDKTIISYQLFKKGNITTRCQVQSKGFGYDENRSVISLAFLDLVTNERN